MSGVEAARSAWKLRLCKDQSGSVAPTFAIMAVVLFGTVGIALDYNRATRSRIAMQTALDAATLAAAKAPVDSRSEIGTAMFNANFKDAETLGVAASFATQPDGRVLGTVNGNVKTTLARLLNVSQIDIEVTALSGIGTGSTTTTTTTTTTPANRVCILLLDPNASQSLLVNGGADVNTTNCEIHVKSTATPAAIYNSGSKVISARTCIAGTAIIDNGGVHPNVELGCTTADDPFAGTLPAPSDSVCTHSGLTFDGGTVNLTPGVYCGWTNFNNSPDVVLAPGVYVIKSGGWNVNGGSWTGNGVTFYFADTSKIQFNSGITSQMSAPESGPYGGILFFEKEGLARSHFVLDDSKGSDLTGLIYLPSRDAIFNSASKADGEKITMVFNTLILDETRWNIKSASKSIAAGPDVVTTTTTTTTSPGAPVLQN